MSFLIKKFSPIILIISFLFLIYTFYKSEIFWSGNLRNYYKTYYLIFSILFFFSIFSFFINDKIKQYLIISGITLVVSLYLFEVYLTFKERFLKEEIYKNQTTNKSDRKKKIEIYKNQTGNKLDGRKRIEIYKDLKKTNDKITITFHPRIILSENSTSIFPLSGISNSKTILCNENGYYAIYESDRYGFNNPDIEWSEKEIRYLLVGDSFTHGACVNRPNDISSVLRKISNKSVLNLGIRGNGPLIQYATLREYLNTNVKKVLWIYYEGNDLDDLKAEKRNIILNNYLKDLKFSQNLKFKQNEIDMFARSVIKKELEKEKKKITKRDIVYFLKITKLRNLLNNYLPKNQHPSYYSYISTSDEFKKILNLTKDLIKQNNSKLYFVYLPTYNRYKTNFDNTNYNIVKNTVTELKIPFIDIHKEVFKKEKDPLKLFPFQMNGHFNVEGYKKVAETIYELTKN